MDKGKCSILILVEHSILTDWVGLEGLGTALKWFPVYQTEDVGGNPGMCQQSILRPSFLFCSHLLYIICRHDIPFHYYADNAQMYIPVKPDNPTSISTSRDCLADIKARMSANYLHLTKQEFLSLCFDKFDHLEGSGGCSKRKKRETCMSE